MGDAVTTAALHEYTTTFSAAMPPVIASENAVSSLLTRPMTTAVTIDSLTPMDTALSRYGDTAAHRMTMGKQMLLFSGSSQYVRQMEAALTRQELKIRGEFNRLGYTGEARIRWSQQRERETMLIEERQRVLEVAKTMEIERKKRTEEQHGRILAQERELEELKHKRAKEMEEERRRCVEEEERLRARQHEREILRMREEAELRIQSHKCVEDQKKTIANTVSNATESMMMRLREEMREQESHWNSRLEQLKLEHSSETAILRQDIERERQLIVRGDSQVTETRAQLNKLILHMEELRRKNEVDIRSRTVEGSLTEENHRAIERLQRALEEDKQSMKQWFIDEQQRMQKSYDSAINEIGENCRTQVRRLETTLEETQRRLRETETEIQESRVKLASAALTTPSASAEEFRLREELRVMRKQLNDETEARQRLERRTCEMERVCDEERKRQHKLQLDMDALRSQHDAELGVLRDKNRWLEDELARVRVAHVEELQSLRKSQRDTENEASHGATKVFEATVQRMNEQHDEARRALELEKMQLTRRLQEEAQQHKDTQRRLRHALDKAEEARCEGERRKQEQVEKDRTISELREMVEELGKKDNALVNWTTRCHVLEQEKEELGLKHMATIEAKDTEVQELRHGLTETQKQVALLKEELDAAQRLREEMETRNNHMKEEAELREKRLHQICEEATQNVQLWKERYTELQTQSAASTPYMQTILSEKDNELSRLFDLVNALTRDKKALEKCVEEQQASFNKREQELIEKTSTVGALTAEIASLRQKMSTTLMPSNEISPRCVTESQNNFTRTTSLRANEFGNTQIISTATAIGDLSTGFRPPVSVVAPASQRAPLESTSTTVGQLDSHSLPSRTDPLILSSPIDNKSLCLTPRTNTILVPPLLPAQAPAPSTNQPVFSTTSLSSVVPLHLLVAPSSGLNTPLSVSPPAPVSVLTPPPMPNFPLAPPVCVQPPAVPPVGQLKAAVPVPVPAPVPTALSFGTSTQQPLLN